MSKGSQKQSSLIRGKKEATFKWWGEWTVLWIIGGFGLTYLIFIPLKVHPLHWLFSFLGGVVGYGMGLFVDTGFPAKAVRFARHSLRRTTLKADRGKQVKRRR